MIGKVTGRLDYIASDHVLIDTGTLGYIVFCSDRTRAAMPQPGGRVALFTEMVVREDAQMLFGFLTLAEKEWHRLLTSVQGIGAKVALAILGTLGPEGVARAISLGDVAAVKAAPGVGPKTAQRVILELRDKAPAIMAMGASAAEPAMVSEPSENDIPLVSDAPKEVPVASTHMVNASAQADALSALANLGYAHGEAASAISQVGDGYDQTADLIRAALKLLAPKA